MKQGRWTAEELTFLREHWGTLDDAALAAKLERTMSSVSHMRLSLGIKRPRGLSDPGGMRAAAATPEAHDGIGRRLTRGLIHCRFSCAEPRSRLRGTVRSSPQENSAPPRHPSRAAFFCS
jgi:hypothetical protein